MSLVTPQIEEYIKTQSWIRRMFETATELKAQYGADNVFDFSLGNPDVPPPSQVGDALAEIAAASAQPSALGYGPNAGIPSVRTALAERISKEQRMEVAAQHVIVTCGAAGALNTILRVILQPGDRVICCAPYFVEYGFYVANYGGQLDAVASTPLTFDIDIQALAAAIGPRTRAMIINSPNNPTGRVYDEDELGAIAALLREKSREFGKPILLVSDEPYRFLTYDGTTVPPVLPAYEYSIVVSSFSKSLSIAGERIGYIAVNPGMQGVDLLLSGMILANRILGFVNAPVIGQYIVEKALTGVDIAIYDERRHAMADLLDAMGLEYAMPKGAFYFFPKAPMDDMAFVRLLLSENIIAVPGAGFGYPGYFRLAYCVDKAIIENSRPAWERARRNYE